MNYRIIILTLCILSTSISFAQIEKKELDSLSNKFDRNNLTQFAYGLNSNGATVSIDENNDLVFTKVVDNLNITKEDIYNRAFTYFVYKYKDANSVIQQQDKEAGIIIGKGYFKDFNCSVGTYKMMGVELTTYDYYSANHILRIDIKDNRARLILTISNYEFSRGASASSLLAGTNSMSPKNTITKKIVDCAPINALTIEERINNELGSKKVSKSIRNNMVIMEKNIIESETKAFTSICKVGANTILELEKTLKGGNTSKNSDNW